MNGYAVVDVEATGRSPWRHRVVEVAVVLLDARLRRQAEFSTLIDPLGPVGPTHVHGIAQDDVAGAPRFREIAPELLEMLADRVLVGHHVACDRSFLEREFARIGVVLPEMPTLCTMRLARDTLREAGGYGLTACVEAAGLGWYPAHTALGDARAAADLLRHFALTRPRPAADCSESAGSADAAGRTECADRTDAAGTVPADWAAPVPAAGVPWPRLAPARSQRPAQAVPLLRREALLGPWPLGAEQSRLLPTAFGGE